jgi:hypothetical protein
MKFKLDENVDLRVMPRFRMAGYDVATVLEQGLISAPDTDVIEICHREERCLITSDLDFSNRGRYDPASYSGIAVIRLPAQVQLSDWCEAIDTLILGLDSSDIAGKLWMIQSKIIQEYQSIIPDEDPNQ